MRFLLIYIILLLVACEQKSNHYEIIPINSYRLNSTIEHDVITFYENDKKVEKIKTWNPRNNNFDGIGYVMAKTAKHDITVSVEFNIYGHISLTVIDSIFEEVILKTSANKNKFLPKKITIVKHDKIVDIFDDPAALGGLDHTGTNVIISELAMSNCILFTNTVIIAYNLYLFRINGGKIPTIDPTI